MERVEITGSRIPRVNAETALLVQIIGRDEIRNSGAQTMEELLERVTGAQGSVSEAQSVGNPDRAGYSGISLHGLGT